VGTDGLVEKEILIEVDRERAAAAGVNIWQLAAELVERQLHAGERPGARRRPQAAAALAGDLSPTSPPSKRAR
jgi:hypothetical protein